MFDFKNYIYDNDIIVQLGANDGVRCEEYGLRHIMKNEGRNLQCHLVEPLPNVFESLKNNYKDSANDIHFYNLAIYNKDGELNFYMNKDTVASSFVINKDNSTVIQVKTNTMKTFLKENNISVIDCLFLDTEGVEDTIIKELLSETSIRPRMIRYEFPHIKDNEELEDFISSYGYRITRCRHMAGDKVCIREDILS